MASSIGSWLRLGQVVGPLLEWWLGKVGWPPQVWCQICVGCTECLEGCLHEVSLGPCVSTRRSEQSATPANESIFFMVGDPTTPLPRGAGTKRILTDPHLPEHFMGTVWGKPMRLPQ